MVFQLSDPGPSTLPGVRSQLLEEQTPTRCRAAGPSQIWRDEHA